MNYVKFNMEILFFTSKDEAFKKDYLRYVRAHLLHKVELDSNRRYVINFVEEPWTQYEIEQLVLLRQSTIDTYRSVISGEPISKDKCIKEIENLHPYHLVLAYQTLEEYERDRDMGIFVEMPKCRYDTLDITANKGIENKELQNEVDNG